MKSILTSVLVLLISSLGLSQSVTTAFETGAGNCDGQAFLVDSTNALTTWNWVDQDTITVLQVDGDTLSNICSGNYFLIYNAGADTLTYSVSEDPCSNFSIFVAHLSQSIPGSCDGEAGVLLYGGVAPFTYQWNAAGNYETVQDLWDLCSDWYAVTVTDSIGCSILDSVFVDVDTNFSSCSAYFYHSLNSNGEMEFYSYASAGSTYSWDFGDGNTSTLPNPVHEYATVGTYQVNLFLTTPDGCTQGRSKGVNASPPTSCDAYFISINDSIDQSLIYLVNLSSGMDTVQYSWDMGDGAVYSTETPSHSYSGSGPYNVCLTITDGDSCVNTHCRNVESFTKAGDFTVLVVEPEILRLSLLRCQILKAIRMLSFFQTQYKTYLM